MGLTILMRMFNNVKYRDVICLRDTFSTSLTMLGLESKSSFSSTINENLLLFCRKFSAFVVVAIT